MARQGINTGTSPNSGTGDSLRVGGAKMNDNFLEVYNLLGDGTTLSPGVVTSIVAGSGVGIDTAVGQVTITSTSTASTAEVRSNTLVVSGVSTLGSSNGIGTVTIGTGSTALYVDGNARVIGILTVGRDSITIDGSGANPFIQCGSGLTISGTSGAETIMVGSGIMMDSVSGVITATEIHMNNEVLTGSGNTMSALTVTGVTTLTNQAQIRSSDSTPGRLDFYCEVSNAHYTRIQAPPHATYSGNNTITLPVTTGTLLNTDGDGSALSGIVTQIVAGSNITLTGGPTGIVTIASSGGGGGGIGTDGSVNTTGIITASAFHGDGSNLTGLTGVAGTFSVGYASTDGDTPRIVGSAITQINFVGTGYTVTASGGAATVRNLGMGMTTLTITSAGYATTVTQGSQISYTATASDANAKFFIEDAPVGLGQIGINYDSGAMGGGQNASPGTYDVTLRAATFFGLSEPFKVRFVVDSFTLNMNNMFGDPTTFVMMTDDNDDAVFTSLSSGGLVSYDGANYVIDRSNSNYATATKHALYYDNTNNVLYGFRTNSSNSSIFAINKWTSVSNASDGTTVGSGSLVTWEDWADDYASRPASGIHTTSGGAGIAAYQPGGNYTHFYGGAFAMKITTTGGLMNNFGTKASPNNGWAYGFTLEDPWLVTGAANQMLTPESASDGWHNFGLAIFNISSTTYDYVSYGSNGYGPYNTGTGVNASRQTNTNNIANAGDTVQVRWDGTNYKLYINGSEVSSTTSQSTYMSSSGTTNPVLTFGDTTAQNGGTIINDYAEGNPWPFRIRDLWIANNGNISASDVAGVGTFTSRNIASWSEYSDVDVYITMDQSGVTAVKGSPTVERKSITFS